MDSEGADDRMLRMMRKLQWCRELSDTPKSVRLISQLLFLNLYCILRSILRNKAL
jgi:hypothetical protein